MSTPENLGQGTLKLYGKTAAAQFCKGQHDDLTSAVIGVIKEANANITKQQIARVCEFANHAVWSNIFSGQDKTAGFPTADAEKVVHSVFTTGDRPSTIRLEHSDYSKKPSEIFKGASARYTKHIRGPEYDFPELPEPEKTASQGSPAHNAIQEKLSSMGVRPEYIQDQMYKEFMHGRQYLNEHIVRASNMHKAAAARLCEEAIQAHFDGIPYEDMVQAIKQAGGPREWNKSAAVDFVGGVLRARNFLAYDPDEQLYDAIQQTKTASPNHPLILAYLDMKKTAESLTADFQTWRQMHEVFIPLHESMLEKAASAASSAAGGLGKVLGGTGQLLGHGAEMVGKGVARAGSAFGRFAAEHPFSATAALGGGVMFGEPLARQTIGVARDLGNQVIEGASAPFRDFTDRPEHPQFGTLYRG